MFPSLRVSRSSVSSRWQKDRGLLHWRANVDQEGSGTLYRFDQGWNRLDASRRVALRRCDLPSVQRIRFRLNDLTTRRGSRGHQFRDHFTSKTLGRFASRRSRRSFPLLAVATWTRQVSGNAWFHVNESKPSNRVPSLAIRFVRERCAKLLHEKTRRPGYANSSSVTKNKCRTTFTPKTGENSVSRLEGQGFPNFYGTKLLTRGTKKKYTKKSSKNLRYSEKRGESVQSMFYVVF